MKYSIIIPVFNRPDEVDELLESLCQQKVKDFEVLIVEDGSHRDCKSVVDKYADRLDVKYFMKSNSGPGQSRNYGAERANGDWLIILDSDVVLPDGYLGAIDKEINNEELIINNYDYQTNTDSSVDSSARQNGVQGNHNSSSLIINSEITAFGGPDAAHPSFTPVQKAISYSMTSFFTTGGIRGGKAKLDKFYPRSFNMGIRRDVYLKLGGFSKMRFGEDIDFSYRIVEAGYKTRLFPEAWVWHKRRTDFRKFFRQVYNSGIARINLTKRHPGTLKLVHLLPTVFTLGVFGCLMLFGLGAALYCYGEWLDAYGLRPTDNMHQGVGFVFCILALLPLLFYSLIIFIDSSIRNRSLWVGLLSIPAAFVQLTGYGLGFITAWWKRCVLKQDEFTAFERTFYN
jgi:glycosyltransferase involved in cell wall biosynthesis